MQFHPIVGRQRRAFFAACICLSGVLVATSEASADAAIVVDASKTVAQCNNCDDLKALQNIFQGASIPGEPASQQARTLLRPVIANLRMKRLRLLQSDNTCDIDSQGKFGSVKVTGYDPAWTALLGHESYFSFAPADGSGVCDLIDYTLPWVERGLSPHFAVASFLPPSFEQYGAAETWSPQTLKRYNDYAAQLVRYILTKSFDAGAPSVVFEVSNELDIADELPLNWNQATPTAALLPPLRPWGRWLWWIDPSSYDLYGSQGMPGSYPSKNDVRRVEHGISPVQKIYADIIDKIRKGNDDVLGNKYAGKTIIIAGPAFAGTSFQWYPVPFNPDGTPKAPEPTLEERFLDQMLNQPTPGANTSLDQFSFHYYGDFRNGFGFIPGGEHYSSLKAVTGTIKAKLAGLNRSDIGLFASEWGPVPNATPGTSPNPVINYSHAGAAWAAAFLTEAVDDGISMGSYLILSDAVGPQPTGNLYLQSLTHKETGSDGTVHYYPKPVANVFQMFATMTGTRKDVTVLPAAAGTDSNLGAFAVSDDLSAGVVVFNYNSDLVFHNDEQSKPDTPETFSIEFDNLPFRDSGVTVKQFLVDANTSNLYAFYNNANHPSPNLQLVDQFSAATQAGKLVLPNQYSLGLGATFFLILPSGD